MGWKDQIMEFLGTLGDDTEDADESAEIEGDASEADTGEAEADADAGEADAETEEIEHADGEADAEEGTPGTAEDGSAEDDDLRATITEQAALIETMRNTIAALGGEDPTETAAEAETEIIEDPTEEEMVDSFDTDYAERKARLSEIKD